jgi:hypothetical protein
MKVVKTSDRLPTRRDGRWYFLWSNAFQQYGSPGHMPDLYTFAQALSRLKMYPDSFPYWVGFEIPTPEGHRQGNYKPISINNPYNSEIKY